MSWIKRRGQTTPSPNAPPPVQMYNPNQHTGQEWQQQQPQHNWYNQTTQQYQLKEESQPQTQSYWQPYTPVQPPPPQQSYPQNLQPYGQYPAANQQQQTYRNLQYNQQYIQNNMYPAQQPTQQQSGEGDAWNWGWGDEDNSNEQSLAQQISSLPNQPISNIDEKFTNDESWNWTMEEKNVPIQQSVAKLENNVTVGDELFPKVSKVLKPPEIDNLRTADHLTVSGKRGKLETPQWSIESQLSQESYEDMLHTSDSDKSHMLSRSSTISHSPISGQDSLPPAASNYHLEEIPSKPEPYFEENSASLHQSENKEIVTNALLKINPTPPPPQNTQTPPLLPPPTTSEDGMNPYKRTSALNHKGIKYRSSPPESKQMFQSNFHNQTVNLETLPDNSEQPDHVPAIPNLQQKYSKPLLPWPDNNEAPINDRNQYLETGQLSDVNLDYNRDNNKTDNSQDTLPPPGLRRMVPGQMEQTENPLTHFNDEPPPGLSRMVLGQTESSSSNVNSLQVIEPPEGLHRMIPGESSSPESTLRHQQAIREENISEPEFDHLVSHTPQPRSATIGADTPPVVVAPINRSETIGGDTSTILTTVGAIGVDGKKQDLIKKSEGNRRDSIEGQTQDHDLSNLTNSVRNLTVGENLTDGHTSNNSLTEVGGRRHSHQETSDSEEEIRIPRNRDKRSMEKNKRDPDNTKHKERDNSPDGYKDKKYEKRRYRDRRYDDDTDYYSDKENGRRNRDERGRDYDRKYSSLRKTDKDRKRKDTRDYGRDSRRNDYYYQRYEDDYDNEANRSRPSSRSDSMHESYRDRGHERDHRDRRHRDRDRERDRYRRQRQDPREMYNVFPGFGYDAYNPYYQQYQYYKNLRRTNPQAYAEWYRKYYQQAAAQSSTYGGEDRASVHSGRSSANDELAKDRYTRQSYYSQASLPHLGDYYGENHTHSMSGQYGLDSSSYSRQFDQTDASLNYDDKNITTQRLTPVKFSTAHTKATISSGKLLKIFPNYPIDGQSALVEIYSVASLLVNDGEYKELNEFPGPLVKGVTHKKTIIEYCENKIKGAYFNAVDIVDPESYILMWELLILLIRQNGMVVGTDIAELLLKNREVVVRPSSVISSIGSNQAEQNLAPDGGSSLHVSDTNGSLNSILKEEEITNKFREYLLYGSGKEALEWAMKHGLWGHALFLASKLDKRTYANVMMRFANGLTLNDPLQTLYQLLSGKMPAAVTCVSDEKWGDWRPHLAMILSNSNQRPELNCKAISALGDTLFNRGSLYAAQFCYLMAEVGFGKHGNPETKLVLLGSDHTKPYPQFATNEAIHMTEIYEYACALNDPEFIIPEFQAFKYLLATRLADRGLLEKSLLYLEKVSGYIVRNPSAIEAKLVDAVYKLADKLKFYDPVGEVEDESEFGSLLETSRPENSWLKDLRSVLNDFNAGLIQQEILETRKTDANSAENIDTTTNTENWQPQQQYEQYQWQQPDQQQINQVEYQQSAIPQQNVYSAAQFTDQQQQQSQYWGQDQQWSDQTSLNQYSQESIDQQQQSYYGSNALSEPKEVQKDTPENVPQISMPNQQSKPMFDDEPISSETGKTANKESSKPQPSSQEKPASNGWFGGIFSKLAIKPKNQMKLPDDKNPKIVWDQDKKRWVNVDEDNTESSSEFKPPPKMVDLMPKSGPPSSSAGFVPTAAPTSNPNVPVSSNLGKVSEQQQQQTQQQLFAGSVGNLNSSEDSLKAAQQHQQNMFKMQRNRNLKKSYVDVFNPGGKSDGPKSLPNPDTFNQSAAAAAATQMNFFIPQPVHDPNAPTDFLTPAPPLQFNDSSQPQ